MEDPWITQNGQDGIDLIQVEQTMSEVGLDPDRLEDLNETPNEITPWGFGVLG